MTDSAFVTVESVTPKQSPSADPVAHVAVLVSLNFPDMNAETAALVRRFTAVALQELVEQGVSYELFDTSEPLADPALVARCVGLLMLGGGDVDGSLYGAPDGDVPNSYGVDLRADHDGIAAAEAAVADDLPVLGICRGSQLLNVARGGTIIPDIDDFGLHRGGPGEEMFLDEEILLEPSSRIARLLGNERITVRSGHHQAVDRIGRGLVITARAHDGIVEGFEDPDRWLVGVQWHPEDDRGSAEDRRRLFAGFVEACVARRALTQR